MCEMCEGQALDDYLDRVRDLVRAHGWALQSVGGGGGVGWVYTIGLTSSYGHPELLTIDTDVGRAARLLNRLGGAIRDGTVVSPGADLDPDGPPIELIRIHPVHTRGELLATWHALQSHPDGRSELEVLQVRVPAVVASGPRALRERLDRPYARTP